MWICCHLFTDRCFVFFLHPTYNCFLYQRSWPCHIKVWQDRSRPNDMKAVEALIFFWVHCESTMKSLIWASCGASRGFLYSKCWVKIKLGKTLEEILNRFDTNYTVLLVWKYTLLESLTIIILNYKHCKHTYSRPINEAILCMQCP